VKVDVAIQFGSMRFEDISILGATLVSGGLRHSAIRASISDTMCNLRVVGDSMGFGVEASLSFRTGVRGGVAAF
jgi:hypothetical protein